MVSVGESIRDGHLKPSVDQVVLRLVDATSELRSSTKPIDGPRELRERLAAVMQEIQGIHDDLLLLIHCSQLEESGFSEKVEEVQTMLANGWKPESAPVEDVVQRLVAARKQAK